MSALTDKLARLRADLAAATPGPLGTIDLGHLIATRKDGQHLFEAVVARFDPDVEAAVSAVNAAPTLIDIAEAAAKYREAVDVRSNESNPASRLILFSVVMQAEAALFAALDRAEAEAAR